MVRSLNDAGLAQDVQISSSLELEYELGVQRRNSVQDCVLDLSTHARATLAGGYLLACLRSIYLLISFLLTVGCLQFGLPERKFDASSCMYTLQR